MAIQTAERSSHLDPSENVIFQRHMIAYKQAANLINGTVLEIGCGEGYGISELAKYAKKYIGVDKFDTYISEKLMTENDIVFHKMEIPPLLNIESDSVDFVVTFQVIEHIQDDNFFLEEIHRVLKPGGILLLHLVNVNKFDPIIPPSNPIIGVSPQDYMDNRITKSEVIFDKLNYKSDFIIDKNVNINNQLREPNCIFKEKWS